MKFAATVSALLIGSAAAFQAPTMTFSLEGKRPLLLRPLLPLLEDHLPLLRPGPTPAHPKPFPSPKPSPPLTEQCLEILDLTPLVSPLPLLAPGSRVLRDATDKSVTSPGTVRLSSSTDVSPKLPLLDSSGPGFSEPSPETTGPVSMLTLTPTPLRLSERFPDLPFSKSSLS